MATIEKSRTQTKKFIAEPWQLEDLAYLAVRHNDEEGSANWSEMGCYKTSTVLWLAEKLVERLPAPRILIITTATGKGTYYEAIPALLPKFSILNIDTRGVFFVLPGGKKVRMGSRLAEKVDVPHIVLSHYNVFTRRMKDEPKRIHTVDSITGQKKSMVVKDKNGVIVMEPWTMADYLCEREWDMVILDEAHRIKNRKGTAWVKHIKQLKAPIRHVMTGTGFINRPDEIWSLLNFLDPIEYASFWHFRDKYCEIDISTGMEKVIGINPDYKDEFRSLVRTIGVRRTLDEVMPHIKTPIFVKREVDLNETQRKMFDSIKRDLYTMDQKGISLESPNVLSALSRMRQICVATPEVISDEYDPKQDRRVIKIKLTEPSTKLDELMELIEELSWDEDSKQQVVVFSCFKDPLELLKVRFDNRKRNGLPDPVSYIHMRESDNEAQRYYKWFELFPQKQHQVFMATLQLGSESINLSCARHIVFLDRDWSPKNNQQGIGRVRRPGQTGQPVVINIEATDTTDEYLEQTNIRKVGWFKQIFGEENNNNGN